MAIDGAPEGTWLRADRQTGGRGRSGRTWVSPPGNLYASTLVRLRDGDPSSPTLALTAGVALHAALSPIFSHLAGTRKAELLLKWPNDLLVDARKLAGILLERVDDFVIVGIGANLASHPGESERPSTDVAAETGAALTPDAFVTDLARRFAGALARWRESLVDIQAAWLAAAHPIGTPLSTHDAAGLRVAGTFDGLAPDGACRLRLADGAIRLIHAGDLFLV